MAYTPFIFWKQPGKKEIFTIVEPQVKTIEEPQLSKEGFLCFPYDKKEKAYFFEGAIIQTSQISLPDISSKTNQITIEKKEDEYIELVNNAINKISKNDFKKVVLARSVSENLSDNFNLKLFFNKLCNTYDQAFVYCMGFENQIWIGASPEVFLKKKDNSFLTNALAGTKQLKEDITFGDKEKEEQQLVKNYIVDLLKNQKAEDIEISQVAELNTGNLKHLINEIRFTTNFPLKIISNLHPTPAVCGVPLNEASDFINKNENLEREFYTGYLGPVYKNEDFSFWVNLRCAKIKNSIIKFYAGAGIVKDSLAETEWLETERKIDTLRSLL